MIRFGDIEAKDPHVLSLLMRSAAGFITWWFIRKNVTGARLNPTFLFSKPWFRQTPIVFVAVEPAIDFILILNFYIAPPSHVSIIKLVSLGRDMTHRELPVSEVDLPLVAASPCSQRAPRLPAEPIWISNHRVACVCVTGKYLNWAWWNCLVFNEIFAGAGSGVLQLQRKLPISSLRGYSPALTKVLLTAVLQADCSAQASWTQPCSTSVWFVLQCFPLKKIKVFYHLNILCILSFVCLVLEPRCAVTLRYLHSWGRRRAMNSSQSQPNLS